MNRNEEWDKMKKEYHDIKTPEHGREQMESAIRRAKMDKKRVHRRRVIRNWGIGLAAAFALVILPNTNADIAYAMERIPVIGEIFKVVTVRNFSHNDDHNQAKVEVPQIIDENTQSAAAGEAVEQINQSVEEWTNELVEKFQSEVSDQGYQGLEITYETVMDTDTWFTLVVYGLETKASGFQFSRYYHIDKKTGQIAVLKDLFKENADYKTPISQEILKQMKAQMEAEESDYFISEEDTDPFTTIQDNPNFYFNTDGSIVIVFDEYEVGPGYIGEPQFIIPNHIISSILK